MDPDDAVITIFERAGSVRLPDRFRRTGRRRRLRPFVASLERQVQCDANPEAPSGCSMAMAPPLALTFFGSRPSSLVEATPTAAAPSEICDAEPAVMVQLRGKGSDPIAPSWLFKVLVCPRARRGHRRLAAMRAALRRGVQLRTAKPADARGSSTRSSRRVDLHSATTSTAFAIATPTHTACRTAKQSTHVSRSKLP